MKTKMKTQKGFTIVEIVVVVWVLFVAAILGGLVISAFHFIAKMW